MTRTREFFLAALSGLLVFAVATPALSERFFAPLVFALGALYFMLWAFQKEPVRLAWMLVPLAAMALWAWLPQSLARFQWTAYLVLAFLSVQLFASRRLRIYFLQFCAMFGAAFALAALLHFHGSLPNRNHFAAFMELILPIACWQAVRTRNPLYAAAGGLIFVSIVISTSRTGIVLAAAELLFIAAAAVRGRDGIRLNSVLAAGAVAGVLMIVAGGAARNRFDNLAFDAGHTTRGLTARASIAMFREKPWLGWGLGTWERVYPHFTELDTGFHLIHADNDWLEWTAEGGLPFLIFLVALAAFAIRNVWREPWSVGITAALLHGFTEFPLQKRAVMSMLVVLLANSAMARRKD